MAIRPSGWYEPNGGHNMITDIDPNTADRGRPSPNVHDMLPHASLMAKGTNSTNYTTPSTNQSEIVAGKNGQFTIVQSGTFTLANSIVTNNPGAGNFGADNFLVYQVPHNLGFTPGVIAFAIGSDGSWTSMPYYKYQTSGGGLAVWVTWICFVDDTYVYIYLRDMTYGNAGWTLLPIGWTFKWYLTQQTSN